MPFCIVETIENNKKSLTICPSTWVRLGILRWPKRKAARKSKIEHSMPEEDWSRMLCKVKREFQNYEDAERQLSVMLNISETEEEENRNANTAKQFIENFNESADQLCQSINTPNARQVAENSNGSSFKTVNMGPVYFNAISTPNQATVSMQDAVINHQHMEIITENSFIDPKTFVINKKKEETPQTSSKTNNFLLPQGEVTNQDLLYNQKLLFDNQTRITKYLAKLNVKIEKLLPENNPIKLPEETVVIYNEEIKKNPFNARVSPVKNITELQHLENQLRDPATRNMYKDLYSVFCTPGKKAEVCAYQLVDVFFSREFLVECSWSGSSRGLGTKISIKLFRNILDLLFEIVYDCDQSYTVDKNHCFFKAALKNAVKRTKTKLERTSAPRKTPKRKPATKTGGKTKDTNTEDSGTRDPVEQKTNEDKNPKTKNKVDETKDITEEYVELKTSKTKSTFTSGNKAKRPKTEDFNTEDLENVANIEVIKQKRNKDKNLKTVNILSVHKCINEEYYVDLNAKNKDKKVKMQDDIIRKEATNVNKNKNKTVEDIDNTHKEENRTNKDNQNTDDDNEFIANEKMPNEDKSEHSDVIMINENENGKNDVTMPNMDDRGEYDRIMPNEDEVYDTELMSNGDKSKENGTDGDSNEDENDEYESDDNKSEEDEDASKGKNIMKIKTEKM